MNITMHIEHSLNKYRFLRLTFLTLALSCNPVTAEDQIELETTTIRGNKELPKILYVIPWKDAKRSKNKDNDQELVLHSLFGDLFDPLAPSISDLQEQPSQRQ